MIGAIGAGLAGAGMIGGLLNKSSDKMSPYLQAALNEISKVQVPDAESLKIKLQQYVQQGLMTPEDAQASLVDYNAYDNTAPNAQARGAQMSALQELQDQVANGGLTDTTRSQIQHTLDDVNNTERGQQESILENAHRRGVSGSGLELANQLMSQQHAADTAGRQGMDIAAMAEQAKSEALKSAASLGGQIESQDYSEQSSKAAAQNAINQFNATNQQQVTMANIAARNAAQAANLSEKQRITDTNTANENANRERNANLVEQNYQDRMGKAQAVAGVMGQQGQAAQHSSDINTSNRQNVFSGLTSGGTLLGLTAMQDQKKKAATPTNESPFTFAHGGTVPGQAPYPGDDERNDVVPAMVSPGEKIIPRTEASEYDSFMEGMPRSEQKPTADAVRIVLQALSGMGC